MRIAEEMDHFARLDDPAFLAERARVRERLARLPDNTEGRAELERLYAAMNLEFDRRASAAWATADRTGRLTAKRTGE
jgi:hypothetical protein